MKIATKDIKVKEAHLTLTNQRVVFWKDKKTLILSDLHIGKTAHFRRSGIPIPFDVLQKDLHRLEYTINQFKPEVLLIVGDLFHAGYNTDVSLFNTWIQKIGVKIILIKGNHDKAISKLYENLNIDIIENALELDPFVFTHDIKDVKTHEFYVSGHTHPGILIKGQGRQRIKLPCYQLLRNQLVLPAFSLFTGLNTNTNTQILKYFAFTDTTIIEI